MRPDIEVTSFFNKVAAALELTPEQKDWAWQIMTKANVGRDDPTSIFFCVLSKMDGMTSGLLGEMDKHLATTLKGMRSTLTAEVQKHLASLPETMSAKLNGQLENIMRDLVNNVDMLVTQEAARRQNYRVALLVGIAALLTVAAASGGYVFGRDTLTADAARWSNVVNLDDGGKWLALARLNDIDKVLAQTCSAGDGRVISGGKVCDLTMFVTQPVGSSQGVDYVRLSFAEFANKLGTWGILGIGAVLGFIAGRLWKRNRYA